MFKGYFFKKMVWILILQIIKHKQIFYFQNKCITKIKSKSKNKINLKQNKFYLPKNKMETWKKQKKSQNKWKINLTLVWLDVDCCSKL
jgi:hypothetical protein